MAGEEKQKAGVVAIHSQVMKIKQEIEKIKHPSLDQQPEIRIRHVFLRDFSRQRSRSPLGLAHRPISVDIKFRRPTQSSGHCFHVIFVNGTYAVHHISVSSTSCRHMTTCPTNSHGHEIPALVVRRRRQHDLMNGPSRHGRETETHLNPGNRIQHAVQSDRDQPSMARTTEEGVLYFWQW
ncbi:uncharacterized protein G2W53_035366 [Senna tora]|uniref:Uncharacterized protein n=1 Tax=Senna tora TaxID=362788 RepID=A0A834W4V2_9FABA|nr:uncharacterized protein G2W53_035366 [Senna tora]